MEKKRLILFLTVLVLLILSVPSALSEYELYLHAYIVDPDGAVTFYKKWYIEDVPEDHHNYAPYAINNFGTGTTPFSTHRAVTKFDLSTLDSPKHGQYYLCFTTNVKNFVKAELSTEWERVDLCEELFELRSDKGAIDGDLALDHIGVITEAFMVNDKCQDDRFIKDCDFKVDGCKFNLYEGTAERIEPTTIKVGDWVRCGVETGPCERGWKKCLEDDKSDPDDPTDQLFRTDKWDYPYDYCKQSPDDGAPLINTPLGGKAEGSAVVGPLVELCRTAPLFNGGAFVTASDENCDGVYDDYGIVKGTYEKNHADDPGIDFCSSHPGVCRSGIPVYSKDVIPASYQAILDIFGKTSSMQLLQCSEYSGDAQAGPDASADKFIRDCSVNLAPGEVNGEWVGNDRFDQNSGGCCGETTTLEEYYHKWLDDWVAPLSEWPTACWSSSSLMDDALASDAQIVYYDESETDANTIALRWNSERSNAMVTNACDVRYARTDATGCAAGAGQRYGTARYLAVTPYSS